MAMAATVNHLNYGVFLLLLLLLLLFSCFCTCNAQTTTNKTTTTDTIKPTQPLGYQDRLVSARGSFILGFFESDQKLYLGLWCVNITSSPNADDRVWVANRDAPISNLTSGRASANLTLDSDGILKIAHAGEGSPIVLNPDANQSAPNSVATLQDTGNFVLTELNPDGSAKRILWQTFDYPANTLLAGMKLGVNLKTGHVWSLTSWLSESVPAPGAFALAWNASDYNGAGQMVIKRRGGVYWTSGPYNASRQSFEFVDWMRSYNISFVDNEDGRYLTYSGGLGRGGISRWKLGATGELRDMNGQMIIGPGVVFCDQYENRRLVPGCAAPNPRECRKKKEYQPQVGNFNGNPYSQSDNFSLGLSDCMSLCWSDCFCAGFNTNANETGCSLYGNNLSFISADRLVNAATVYRITNSSSTTNTSPGSGTSSQLSPTKAIWVVISSVMAFIIFLLGFICHLRRKQREKERNEEELLRVFAESDGVTDSVELISEGKRGPGVKIFSFDSIVAATDNFSPENKLGEGGFGPVFKGKLPEGQEIAVKRLSRGSGQGLLEFKNEIIVIAKLQHTNLVRLLGCCIKGDEKMLVYEFMPNKSLDFFLFDPSRKGLLNWKKRLSIIEGIAQGILYLHKYSRLRIIHRDLKASNILLDSEMNPKISDFGMARIFGRNDNEANTHRVVGTYGYMPPEYAMEGTFSEKSDIYSFGVLLLEIVSGRKNSSFFHHERSLHLVGHAWELWKEGSSQELVDTMLCDSFPSTQLLRVIHVGLLCVQESAADRPTTSLVVSMLSNETIPLPLPKQPAFTSRDTVERQNIEIRDKESCSASVTVSLIEPR